MKVWGNITKSSIQISFFHSIRPCSPSITSLFMKQSHCGLNTVMRNMADVKTSNTSDSLNAGTMNSVHHIPSRFFASAKAPTERY